MTRSWYPDVQTRAHRKSRAELDSPTFIEFDFTTRTVTPPSVVLHAQPSARHTDPVTSHLAAAKVREDNSFLIACVRGEVERAQEPLTAFEIAHLVLRSHPNRWQNDTVRSAVARARLTKAGFKTRDTGKAKRAVQAWTLGEKP